MAAMADFNLELARKLKTAFDENILSEQEFNDQKAKLLREIWQPRVEAMRDPREIALEIARKRGRHDDAAFIESVTAIFKRVKRLWDAQSAEILQVLGEREDLRCETSPRRRHRGRSLRRRRWSSHREPDELEDAHSSRSRSRDRDHGRRRSSNSPPPARVEVAPPTPVELDAGHYPNYLQRIRDRNVLLNQGDWDAICEELDDWAMRTAVRNIRLDALITQNELLKDDIDY